MLGPSEGGLGGQDAPDGFPASGRNAYPSGANAFFADVGSYSGLDSSPYGIPRGNQIEARPLYLVYYR